MPKTTDIALIPSTKHRIIAGYIGNVVEWYDFALYGYLAGILASIFFPKDNPTAGLIATYGIFAAGFMLRPVGSAIFGWFGDLYGAAKTMQISIVLMVVPTLILGLLPDYNQIGIWAPILLVLVRMLQGLSVGGEFSSSVTYLVETAPEGKRGLTGSWANIGSMSGSLLGVGVATFLNIIFDLQTILDWAWRLPFLGGALLGLIAIWIRRDVQKSKHFDKFDDLHNKTSPLLEAFTTNRRETLLALVFAASYGTCFYIALVYLPEWLSSQGFMARSQALAINTAMTALIIPLMPLFAIVGDRVVRRRTWIAIAMFCLASMAIPLGLWIVLSDGSLISVIVSHLVFFILLAVPLGSAPSLFVEMFPKHDRLSGYSVSFNLGIGVFGGLTPMIITSIIAVTGITITPVLYLAIACCINVIVLRMIPDKSRVALD